MEKQLVEQEQKIICHQENSLLIRENLLSIYDEIVCSLKLISSDYQQGTFRKQSEVEEIESQLEILNNLLDKWST